jgi:hypothetical protein
VILTGPHKIVEDGNNCKMAQSVNYSIYDVLHADWSYGEKDG